MTFLMKSGGRSYSIAYSDGNRFEFIIKRLENGKGGSKEICDTEVGSQIKAVGPAGHFTLKTTANNRLFLGTGTGFAPLYFQILGTEALKMQGKNRFIFGIRKQKDIFYIDELNAIKEKASDFSYEIFVSREENTPYHYGRITEYITKENIAEFQEFYLCGSPAMVSEAKEKLLALGVSSEVIFSEEY